MDVGCWPYKRLLSSYYQSESPKTFNVKEYVSLLIGLYKNNVSVSWDVINFLLIMSLYLPTIYTM